jgi:ferrous iron transport protein A
MKAAGQAVVTKTPTNLVPLCRLRAGQGGYVGQILGTCDVVHRLREMGLYDGARVQMIRPGSPCIIRLHGQRLGFRMDDCAHVMIGVSAVAS